jgi:hypothetical protein
VTGATVTGCLNNWRLRLLTFNLGTAADWSLFGLRKFSTTIAIHINDLPTTSPHGSYFGTMQKICEF